MQFSDTSTLQGVVQDVHFFCETDSTSYQTNDIVRNVNRWLYRGICWALEADPTWDDRNLTTFNEVTTTLVNGQADYTLPTDMLHLDGVYVKNAQGDYAKMTLFEQSKSGVLFEELFSSSGMPSFYMIESNAIKLGPSPDATQVTTAAGLKIKISREVDVFTNADTTQEIPLGEPFDRLVVHGAVYDYCVAKGLTEKASSHRTEIEAIKRDMAVFYTNRVRDKKTNILPSSIRNRERTII